MTPMMIEPYQPGDRDACLAVFDSNTPRFFRPDEREAFAAFLDAPPGPYLVGRREGAIVACGGYGEDPCAPGSWLLCWGMVVAHLHRQGLGRALLQARLRAAAEAPGFRELRLNTSQHSSGFFERLGFVVTEVERDGYGPGLDRYAMSRLARTAFPKPASHRLVGQAETKCGCVPLSDFVTAACAAPG
ncbi:MAG: family N-acetyltransferase [Caulobacteraceae bacterium]|nr:family N-acetyltransferase [Caulobacteraceae bacterium]